MNATVVATRLAGLFLIGGTAIAAAPSLDWGVTTPVAPSPAGFVNDWLRQDNPYMSSRNLAPSIGAGTK